MSKPFQASFRFNNGDEVVEESLQSTVQRFVGCASESRLITQVTEAVTDLKRRLKQLVDCAEIESVLEKEIRTLESGKMPEKRDAFDLLVQCQELDELASDQQEESMLVFPAHLSFRERRELIQRHATKLNREVDLRIIKIQMRKCEEQTTSDAFLINCKAIIEGARVDHQGVDQPSATLSKLKGLLPDSQKERMVTGWNNGQISDKLEKLHHYMVEKVLKQQERIEEERRKQEKSIFLVKQQPRRAAGADGAAGLPAESPKLAYGGSPRAAANGYEVQGGSPRAGNGYDVRGGAARVPSGYLGLEAPMATIGEAKIAAKRITTSTTKTRNSSKTQKSPGKKVTKGDAWQDSD